MEHRVRPQPEPEGEPILRNGPGFRKGGHHMERIIEFEQPLVELIHDPQGLEVGGPGRIEGADAIGRVVDEEVQAIV